jgi:hypothetical protein
MQVVQAERGGFKRPNCTVQEVLTMARTAEVARVQAQAIDTNGKGKRLLSDP